MRNKQLELILKQTELKCMLLSEHSRIEYLIGQHFECGERFLGLLVNESKTYLWINQLFPVKEIENVEIIFYHDGEDPIKLLSEYLPEGTIGIDENLRSGFLLHLMELNPQCKFIDSTDLVDEMKAIKSEEEIIKMRKASALNDEVMGEVRKLLVQGVSELEVAQSIEQLFLEYTHGEACFETIVGFGENGADPHATPTHRRLKKGDSIIIDMGCRYEGYCSDMTRTFFLEENTFSEIYDLVLKANFAAKAVIAPGVTFAQIDAAARSVIEEAGYGDAFFHRLGHGIGLSVHEPYDVSGVMERKVKEGMCFSIEPGIYLPGMGGVRIEDLVVVTKEGYEALNHYPYDLHVI